MFSQLKSNRLTPTQFHKQIPETNNVSGIIRRLCPRVLLYYIFLCISTKNINILRLKIQKL